jgi:AcrR family transcriptional regulator
MLAARLVEEIGRISTARSGRRRQQSTVSIQYGTSCFVRPDRRAILDVMPSQRGDSPAPTPLAPATRIARAPGRPRSGRVHRAILDAARALLIEEGFADLRLEHVAARAGVGKTTIYRRWPSKEALALELLLGLAAPHIAVAETGDTREELLAAVTNAMRALTDTDFGPVIRALLSQIAINPSLGDPFRSQVVAARRAEVARVIARGVGRGDLRADVDVEIATELLVGPVYFRLMFGGELTQAFAERVVDAVLEGYAARGDASIVAASEADERR